MLSPEKDEAWGPDRSHAPNCTYRMGHCIPCNCPKSNYNYTTEENLATQPGNV